MINYVTHSLSPTIEPVANLCASGVLERFGKLRFATVEAGIGWVPWLLDAMDEAYRKHHMWVRPKLQGLPSDYYRAHGFATFQEDPSGLFLAERYGLTDNFMWANDYPHHEGTWPHSAEAIERTMPMLDETQRAKILGSERGAVLQTGRAGASAAGGGFVARHRRRTRQRLHPKGCSSAGFGGMQARRQSARQSITAIAGRSSVSVGSSGIS